MPPGRLWEAQQAVSGRGGTCPASPRSPGNWKLHVLSPDLEGLVSSVIPSAASSPRMTEKASFCVLRWTEIKALKKSPSHAVLTQRLTGDSDETAWISALCKPGALPQLTDLTDFQDALALRSPNTYKLYISLELRDAWPSNEAMKPLCMWFCTCPYANAISWPMQTNANRDTQQMTKNLFGGRGKGCTKIRKNNFKCRKSNQRETQGISVPWCSFTASRREAENLYKTTCGFNRAK